MVVVDDKIGWWMKIYGNWQKTERWMVGRMEEGEEVSQRMWSGEIP